jgi:threonine/homoserine/homoserine lactone efflux protein
MEPGFLLRGLLMGFAIAAPVGPIGLLCIRRTLSEGRAIGLASGLGAASADALYGFVAAFGLTFVSGLLLGGSFWMRLLGGLFLAYLGLKTLLAPPPERAAAASSGAGLLGAYASTFALTLSNPATILSFATIFAGVGIVGHAGYGAAALLVLGVFLGSALWWLLLSGGVGLLRHRVSHRGLHWVNRIAGALLLAFAAGLLWSLALA